MKKVTYSEKVIKDTSSYNIIEYYTPIYDQENQFTGYFDEEDKQTITIMKFPQFDDNNTNAETTE